jgi:hypothetical protein
MATFRITAPDGTKFKISAPDGATAEEAFAAFEEAQGQAATPQEAAATPSGPISAMGGKGAIASQSMAKALTDPTREQAEGYTPSAVPFLDPINSFAMSAIEGIPVAGPYLGDMVENLDAMTFGDTREKREAINAGDKAQFPDYALAGELAGTIGPLGALGTTAAGARVLGLTGSTLGRVGAGFGSSYALSAADQIARGEDPQKALLEAIIPGVAGAAFPIGEKAIVGILKAGGAKLAPSVEQLKDEASKLYDAARASGTEVNQSGTISLADEMFDLARQEGIISPTGRMTGGYPKITEAVKTFDDFATGGKMTVPQMQAVRRTLQDASGSIDAGERRIGKMMLEKFDDFIEKGVPELKDAAAIYRRAKKGELIETAIELAGARAGQFSGSGFENALRTEFRGLERQIIKGQLKGLSDDEIAAIKKVAEGGQVENVLRNVGRFAPTGVVSFAGSGGVPFLVGNAIGGPAMGATLAAATMGAGFAGRAGATAMQKGNADIASALMRRGGAATLSPSRQRALEVAKALGKLGGMTVPAALMGATQ